MPISCEGLTKHFKGVPAVLDLDLDVEPGRVLGFLGPNGAGKSTTLRLLLGLERPDSGRALINGQPYATLTRPQRTVGALLDASWFDARLTGRASMRWQAAAAGLPRAHADRALERVGLDADADKRVGRYSLGMRQRLALGASLLADPQILVLDEPLNGLDPDGVHDVRRLLREVADAGGAVLVSSHLLSEMMLVADDVLVIAEGRRLYGGSLQAFLDLAAPAVIRVVTPDAERLLGLVERAGGAARRVGRPGGADVGELEVTGLSPEGLGALVHAEHVLVHELSPVRASLEDAYLKTIAEGRAGHRTGLRTAPLSVLT